MKKIVLIILAAGNASRMGTIKQLLPYKETTILNNVIETALKVKVHRRICVLGAHQTIIKNKINQDSIEIITNDNWEKGLSTSIVTGISCLEKDTISYDGVLIVLADQPLISSGYLNKIIEQFTQDSMAIHATPYTNFCGVPAIFPHSFFSELKKLKGDSGAKKLLNKKNNVVIPVNYPVCLNDIDTPKDYDELLKNKGY